MPADTRRGPTLDDLAKAYDRIDDLATRLRAAQDELQACHGQLTQFGVPTHTDEGTERALSGRIFFLTETLLVAHAELQEAGKVQKRMAEAIAQLADLPVDRARAVLQAAAAAIAAPAGQV